MGWLNKKLQFKDSRLAVRTSFNIIDFRRYWMFDHYQPFWMREEKLNHDGGKPQSVYDEVWFVRVHTFSMENLRLVESIDCLCDDELWDVSRGSEPWIIA